MSEQKLGGFVAALQSMVDEPGAVKVDLIPGHDATLVEVSCAQSDLRHLIGRGGRTAGALRQILSTMSGRMGRRFVLQIVE